MRQAHLYPKLLAATLLAGGLTAFAARPAFAAPDGDGIGPDHCESRHGGPGGNGDAGHGGGHRMGMMGGSGPMGMMRGDHLPPFLRGLDLSDAQRDKIFELQHAMQPRQRELMKAVHSSRDALHDLAHGDGFDAKQARQLADQHARAVSELALLHAETGAKLRALLTPEQRKQADEQRSRFERRRHDGHRPA